MTAEREGLKLPPLVGRNVRLRNWLSALRTHKLRGVADLLDRYEAEVVRLQCEDRWDVADESQVQLEMLRARYEVLLDTDDAVWWQEHVRNSPEELLLDRERRPGPVTWRYGR